MLKSAVIARHVLAVALCLAGLSGCDTSNFITPELSFVCGADIQCGAGYRCVASRCRAAATCAATEVCGDGLDNDCNGRTDCADSECAASCAVDAGTGGGATGGGSGGGATGGGATGGGSGGGATGGSGGGATGGSGGGATGGSGGGATGGSGGGATGGSGGGATGGSGGGATGGGGADTTPPFIVNTSPGSGSTMVSATTDVSVTFSEAMVAASVMVTFMPPVSGQSTALSNGDTTVTVSGPRLDFNRLYTVTVAGTDLAGNALTGVRTFSFSTAAAPDTTPPTVTTSPVNNAINVPLAVNIQATFSEEMNPTSVLVICNGGTFDLGQTNWNAGNTIATWSMPVAPDGGIAKFDPATTYRVVLTGNDRSGNGLVADAGASFSFTTTTPPDVTPPTLVSSSPADGGSMPRNAGIQLTFSEPMDAGSVQSSFQIGGAPVTASAQWNTAGTTVVVRPNNNLPLGMTNFTFSSSPGAADRAGNLLVPVQVNFSATAIDATVPSLTSTYPARVAADGGVSVVSPFVRFSFGSSTFSKNNSVQLTFSEPMNRVTTEEAFAVTETGMSLPVEGSFSWDANTMTFTPTQPFAYNASFTITIASTASDAAGNLLPPTPPLMFRTMQLLTTTINPSTTSTGYFTQTGLSTATVTLNGPSTGAGTNSSTQQLQGVVAFPFNTSALANVSYVTNATLTFDQTSVNGSPFAASSVVVEAINIGPTLDGADMFAAAVGASAPVSTNPTPGLRPTNVTSMVRTILESMSPTNYRFRLRLLPPAVTANSSVGFANRAATVLPRTTGSPYLTVYFEAP